jgi:enoyl-CoA hydratase/carnithine racemase
MADLADAPITFEIDGRVAHLTLQRPDKLNALNDDVRRAIAGALTELEERPDVSVLVLSGAGRSFSAGADLATTPYPPIEGDWAARRHRTGTWQRLLDQLGRVPQATVARLHGHVIGGAALLGVACDIRIASDDVVLRIPELVLGIPLTWAGIPLLVREVGLPTARDWVMTCRSVDADELLRTGYATRVVPPAGLDAAVDECVDQLLAAPGGALAMTRAMTAAIGRAEPAMAAAWADADHQRWALTEDEYREAAVTYLKGMRS